MTTYRVGYCQIPDGVLQRFGLGKPENENLYAEDVSVITYLIEGKEYVIEDITTGTGKYSVRLSLRYGTGAVREYDEDTIKTVERLRPDARS